MIDTISFSLFPSPGAIERLKEQLATRMRVCNRTGVVETQLVAGELDGSFDYRVRIAIKDTQWLTGLEHYELPVAGYVIRGFRKAKMPISVSVPEYISVELSLPKWAVGVNFINTDWAQDREWLFDLWAWLSSLACESLPTIDEWLLNRVDVAICYQMGCPAAVEDHVIQLKNAEFNRREGAWRPSGLYFKGDITTVKLYDKHKEFKKHDYRRLKQVFADKKTSTITNMTKGLLRYEVEFHKRFLTDRQIHTVQELIDRREEIGAAMIIQLSQLYGGLERKRYSNIEELIEAINQHEWTSTGVSAATMVSVLTIWSLQGKKAALVAFGRNMFYRCRKLAIERGLTLARIAREPQDKGKLLHLENYQPQPTSDLEKYEKIIFERQISKSVAQF